MDPTISTLRSPEECDLGSTTITLVCTAPPYLLGALITFAMAYNSDRVNERGWHIIVSMTVAIIGFIISVATIEHAHEVLRQLPVHRRLLHGQQYGIRMGSQHY
jgi:hypothetical protein